MWEGGIRVPALVHNPLNSDSQGKTFHGYFIWHIFFLSLILQTKNPFQPQSVPHEWLGTNTPLCSRWPAATGKWGGPRRSRPVGGPLHLQFQPPQKTGARPLWLNNVSTFMVLSVQYALKFSLQKWGLQGCANDYCNAPFFQCDKCDLAGKHTLKNLFSWFIAIPHDFW